MKRILVLLAILIDGMVLGLMVGLLLSTEQRLRLSQQLADVIRDKEARMPDG